MGRDNIFMRQRSQLTFTIVISSSLKAADLGVSIPRRCSQWMSLSHFKHKDTRAVFISRFLSKRKFAKELIFSTILKFDSKKLFRYTWTRAPDIRMFSRKSFFLNDISIRFIDVLCCQHSQWSCLRSDLLSVPILQPQTTSTSLIKPSSSVDLWLRAGQHQPRTTSVK